nr:DEAD/DEAH box helicase [Candidatus Freyarchaeota archaeon]
MKMKVETEPLGFFRLAELLVSKEPSEDQYSTTASFMEKSIRKGLLPERLGAVGRFCSSMCYQLATEYRFKDILREIPKLSDISLAPFEEIFAPPLSKRVFEMTFSFCEEQFQKSYDVSSSINEILGKLIISDQLNYREYIHPRNMDEMKTLADIIIFTNQCSGWILGKDPAENIQTDLPILLKHLKSFDDFLEQREIPAWLYFLSKLFTRVMIKSVDSLSIHTVFHTYPEICEIALDFIKQNHPILWPTQIEPIKAALQKRDILLAAETGTGKSLVGAMMIAVKKKEQGVSVYTVPTRALAHQISEIIVNFAYRGMPDNVRVLTMEDEVGKEELAVCKTLVGTYEKIEGLLRENVILPENINMFVVDECHNISDFSRGVTLDFLLSQMNPHFHCQRLLISAVMPEDQGRRFAQWAKTEYLRGKEWRRTRLLEKIAFGHREVEIPQEADDNTIAQVLQNLEHHVSERRKVEDFVIDKTIELLRQGKVVLVTAESRRKVEQLAEQIAKRITIFVTSPLVPDISLRDKMEENRDQLYQYIHKLESSELVLPKSTESILRLLTRRVVFHHAGLPKSLRQIIEEMIKNRIPLVIVSTSTLEAGVNFPVDAVILKRLVLTKTVGKLKANLEKYRPFDAYVLSRYESTLFSSYHNTIGRAGRAGFTERGESIFFVDNLYEAKEFFDMRYRRSRSLGEGADLYVVSRLVKPSQHDYYEQLPIISIDLTHSRGRFLSNLLQVVYTSGGDLEKILFILKKTWLWEILCELSIIEDVDKNFSSLISSELEELVDMGFLKVGQRGYELTQLGHLVNLSLLSPISAKKVIDCIRSIKTNLPAMQESDIDYCVLNAVGLTYEMRVSPFERPRKLRAESASLRHRLNTFEMLSDNQSILLAAVLYRWIKGYSVDEIIKEFGLHASDHGLLEEIMPKNALWVLQFVKRVSKEIGCPQNLVSRIEELTAFVSEGTDNKIAAKLIEFQIPGLGRSSTLYLVEKLRPVNLSEFTKIQESDFKKQFPGKEELSARILKEIVQKLSDNS